MTPWRLLDTEPLPGILNMAIDQALLATHARGTAPPTLRFYHWHPAAISLGYFQRRHNLDPAACRDLGLDIVRRATGGGAVLHQHSLTYSLVAGVRDGIPHSVAAAYTLLGGGLRRGFALLGIAAEEGAEENGSNGEVCFTRFAPGEALHHGKKFVGSAQTWTGSSLLQHGSIALAPQLQTWCRILCRQGGTEEEYARHLAARMTSVQEILGRDVPHAPLREALLAGLSAALGVTFQPGKLSAEEWRLAREIAAKATP